MKKKVAIIIPYFGKFPEWFKLFLFSCSKNIQIDFLFYTDCEIPDLIYSNTIFTKISFKDYCAKVSSALGINFAPTNRYKLCDCKPFYGIIHKEDIQEYEFWGFGDCDLVYGDLAMIINEENLKKFDFITTHGYCVAGHFTVMRRISKYTLMCLDIPYWRKLLCKQDHCNLDENAYSFVVRPSFKYIHRICRYIVRPLRLSCDDSYYKFVNKFLCNKYSKALFRECNTSPAPNKEDQWLYDSEAGRVYNCQTKDEIPYLHFLFFKKTPYLKTDSFWKDGYYALSPTDERFNSPSSKIIISLDGITYDDN